MAGSLRKKGNKYEFSYMFKGQRYFGSIGINEVKSEKEANNKLQEFCTEVRKGMFINTDYTFLEFSKIWLEQYIKPNFSYSALVCDVKYLNNRILPTLGNYKLAEITPMILNDFVIKIKSSETQYKTRKNHKVSNNTIQKIYNIVRAILNFAFKMDLIRYNPCSKVQLNLNKEVINSNDIHYYDNNQYHLLLNLLKHEDIHKRTIIETAVKTGLRRSELFGLKWNDIDFNNRTLSVNKTRQIIKNKMTELPCKTDSSIRTISISPSLVELLQEYHKMCDSEYIFENINMDSITAWFRYWQEPHGLPRIKFHDLRHTHATLLLYAGVDVKTISQRLGHSNIGMTMNTYTHVIKELDIKASELLDAI